MDIRKFFNSAKPSTPAAPKPAAKTSVSVTTTTSTSTSSKPTPTSTPSLSLPPKAPVTKKKRVLDESSEEVDLESSSSDEFDSDSEEEIVDTKTLKRAKTSTKDLVPTTKTEPKTSSSTSSKAASAATNMPSNIKQDPIAAPATKVDVKQPSVAAPNIQTKSTSFDVSMVPVMPTTSTSANTSTSATADDGKGSSGRSKAAAKFFARGGVAGGTPPNKGKPIPRGGPDSLGYGGGGSKYTSKHGTGKSNTKPLTFVISGTLDSLERKECEDYIKSHGGKVTTAVSGATDYLVLGTDAGEKKQKDAEAKGTQVIDEEGLIELICKRNNIPYPYVPGGSSTSTSSTSSTSSSSSSSSTSSNTDHDTTPTPTPTTPAQSSTTSAIDITSPNTCLTSTSTSTSTSATTSTSRASLYKRKTPPSTTAGPVGTNTPSAAPSAAATATPSAESILLVEKYRPQRIQDIVGNQTNLEEIGQYLQSFASNLQRKAFDDKNGPKKAILLCGPPGTGKTTAAMVCARQYGFEPLEFNASDARSKSIVDDEIGSALMNKSLTSFAGFAKQKRNVCVIMDEVDGMGSGDRGGIAELIKLLPKSSTPLICIANDAQATSIRSLKNHCNTLTWRRVPASTLSKHLMTIASKEGIQVHPNAMEKIVESTHGDIRQCINVIEMWKRGKVNTIAYADAMQHAEQQAKDLDLGPFDIIGKLFKAPDPDWLHTRLDYYFQDADLMSLFVQENYLSCRAPDDLYSTMLASDMISAGDQIQTIIAKDQNYSLMTTHGLISTVLPASQFTGLGARTRFPALLGKTSQRNKRKNMISWLKSNLYDKGVVSNKDLSTYILWIIRQRWFTQLLNSATLDINTLAEEMKSMNIGKDEWDAMIELGEEIGEFDMKRVDTKTKSALSRTLNKIHAGKQDMKVTKSSGKVTSLGLSKLENDGEESDTNDAEGDGEDEENDGDKKKDEIKPTKTKAKSASTSTKAKKK